jgi:DNA-binding response OmpR family regulator
MLLESEGYRVQTAPTAAAALAAKLDNVHLVISDIGLPDLDGRQLLPRLKSKQPMKAIALSGYGTEADLRASLDAGFDRHLTKPVEMHVLLEAVDLACSETRPTAHRSRVRSKPSSASKRTAR